jgi:uncharacterized protein (AIM24 family)
MTVQTIRDFLAANADKQQQTGAFELESNRFLQANLNGDLWIKMGSMVAYRGNIRFEREGVLEQGLGQFLKKTVSGEGARLTRASGQGQLYLADAGKKVTLLQLTNEAIVVNGNDLLAFEPANLKHEITMLRKVAALAAGGLFNVRLTGSGVVAITTHYDPLVLAVRQGQPVFTDPNATVAWSANLQPEFKTDIQLKSFFGRGSGESFQMMFQGEGFVVVQPFEELAFQATANQG